VSSEFSDNTKNKWTDRRQTLLSEFDSLLESIKTSNSKEKLLWKQIYDNAITDRQNAYAAYISLFPGIQKDVDAHGILGDKVSKYIERMRDANEQLLKLATMIRKAIEMETESVETDIDSIIHDTNTENSIFKKGAKH